MGIQDADRVRCAIYMLKDDAALWWEGTVIGLDVAGMTWRDFRTVFFEKYFTEDVRAEDERERLRHFTDGLRPDIKHDVFMADVATYKAAVIKAYRSEIGRREMQAEYQRKRQFQQPSRGQSSQQPAKRSYLGSSKGPNPPRPQRSQQQRPQGQPRQQQQQGAVAPNPGGVPICRSCQRPHSGQCMAGSGRCYHCGEPGHVLKNCPRRKQTTGRLFVMQAEEADPDTSLITGKISIRGVATFALLDSGATHSFISQSFIERVGIVPEVSSSGYDITVPSGEVLFTTSVISGLELEFEGYVVRADLVVFPMTGFDLILVEKPYLGSVKDVDVVRDYPDVFPEDVAGIPPVREVEFGIELLPGTVPIS
ncbi:uncharacterized protein [Henckelia pumila]|uniref:uncharacterized protein n=1 Tax=Henckelia pumila TaxID=405737 RepID=UPI003C6E8328